ncbi:MAG TPA: hypothetical protein HPQ04_13800 [Rhodospirillaceae bacterium]|nr:hypothetical protein [Rhodospirillaceae bacterium]
MSRYKTLWIAAGIGLATASGTVQAAEEKPAPQAVVVDTDAAEAQRRQDEAAAKAAQADHDARLEKLRQQQERDQASSDEAMRRAQGQATINGAAAGAAAKRR